LKLTSAAAPRVLRSVARTDVSQACTALAGGTPLAERGAAVAAAADAGAAPAGAEAGCANALAPMRRKRLVAAAMGFMRAV
jgi:hypothetical protein